MIKKDLSNLTILIQGPFNNLVLSSIKNYTKYKVKIVLVVWNNEREDYVNKLGQLINDRIKFIFIQDPGGQKSSIREKMNVNRQLVSTKEGLKVVDTEYCMKSRSDVQINLDKLVLWYNKYNKLEGNTEFYERVLLLNLTTINPKKKQRLFAFNDWIYVGNNKDLNKLLSSDLYPDDYLSFLHENHDNTSLRYNAEQWMVIKGLLGEDFSQKFPNSYSYDEELISLYYKMLNYFIVIPPKLIGLKSSKYKDYQFGLWNVFTFKEWKKEVLKEEYYYDLENIKGKLLKKLYQIKSKL